MNQAQRHLWARAYALPDPTIGNCFQCGQSVSKPEWQSGTVYSPKPEIYVHTSHKPRILVAKPREKPLNRNDKIRLSLERAYPTEAKNILDQAYAAYYYTRPATANLPELYELLESGFLDLGIEACGLHSWVIGRVSK